MSKNIRRHVFQETTRDVLISTNPMWVGKIWHGDILLVCILDLDGSSRGDPRTAQWRDQRLLSFAAKVVGAVEGKDAMGAEGKPWSSNFDVDRLRWLARLFAEEKSSDTISIMKALTVVVQEGNMV
jgi:hypothetical protein